MNEITILLRYYKSDNDIQEDWQLQGFVNEITADGNKTNGGRACYIISKYMYMLVLKIVFSFLHLHYSNLLQPFLTVLPYSSLF